MFRLGQQPLGLAPLDIAASIDLRGLRADALLLRLSNAIARRQPSQLVEVTMNAGQRSELAGWARLSGNELVLHAEAEGDLRCVVRVRTSSSTELPDWGLPVQGNAAALPFREWLTGRAGSVPERAPTYYGLMPRGAAAGDRELLPSY